MSWIDETGFKVSLFLAGCAGAVASFLKPQKLTWYERALTIVSGGFSAMYLTPFAVSGIENFKEVGHPGELALAYLIGYSGLKTIELAIYQIKKRFFKSE